MKLRNLLPLAILATAVLPGCSGFIGYYGEQYKLASEEPAPAPATRPIAREVVWFMEYQLPTTDANYHVDEVTQKKLERDGEVAPPTEAMEAAALLRHKAQQARDAGQTKQSDAFDVMAAHAEAMAPARAPAMKMGKLMYEKMWTVAGAVVAQVERKQIDEAVKWALTSAGAVGEEAPEGSVLYVYMRKVGTKNSDISGYEWELSAQLVLDHPAGDIQTTRALPLVIYGGKKAPESTPAGMVKALEVETEVLNDAPRGAEIFWDVALVTRSAALELVQAHQGA